MGDVLIRTTARFQDAQEPIKQRPIIQVDRVALPNTIRVSIESGRDNPFRPDGEIYKSADPIVDYYKYGPNQSRTQSPTDSQLLLNGSQSGEGSSKKDKRRKKKEKKKELDGTETKKKPCWRRWLCCCCCCCKCCDKKETADTTPTTTTTTTTTTTVIDNNNKVNDSNQAQTKEKQTKIVVLRDPDESDLKFEHIPTINTKKSRIEFISGSSVGDVLNNDDDPSLMASEENKSQQVNQKKETNSKNQNETRAKQQQEGKSGNNRKSNDNKSSSKCVVS